MPVVVSLGAGSEATSVTGWHHGTIPRTVLLSGVCGSGKTAITELGYERLREALGAPASIDTDRLFMMIDPDWALPYDSARAELVYRQVGLLAESFFDFGLDTVLVVGNALHTPEDLDLVLPPLLERGAVFHVTLDPSLTEIVRRVRQRGDEKTDEWLAAHVSWMRDKYGPWTARIDNTTLTPSETLRAIAAEIARGAGRLHATFGA
jgi:hypothetical protein